MVYKATYNWRCTSFWWTLMISPSQNSEEKSDFSSQTNDGIDIWLVVWNIFPYIGNNDPNWLIFFRGIETTNQYLIGTTIGICALLFFQSLSKRCVVAVMATQTGEVCTSRETIGLGQKSAVEPEGIGHPNALTFGCVRCCVLRPVRSCIIVCCCL